MKTIRWTAHALQNLIDRELDQALVEDTLTHPHDIAPTPPGRHIYMRRYWDHSLQQEMLLRVVIEESSMETVIVTLYKTSRISRYLRGC